MRANLHSRCERDLANTLFADTEDTEIATLVETRDLVQERLGLPFGNENGEEAS